MAKFSVGEEFLSEGHRFRVTEVSGQTLIAEEVATGRTRTATVHAERTGEADLEWMDGDANWHRRGEEMRMNTVAASPPGDPLGPSRFDREFDFED